MLYWSLQEDSEAKRGQIKAIRYLNIFIFFDKRLRDSLLILMASPFSIRLRLFIKQKCLYNLGRHLFNVESCLFIEQTRLYNLGRYLFNARLSHFIIGQSHFIAERSLFARTFQVQIYLIGAIRNQGFTTFNSVFSKVCVLSARWR